MQQLAVCHGLKGHWSVLMVDLFLVSLLLFWLRSRKLEAVRFNIPSFTYLLPDTASTLEIPECLAHFQRLNDYTLFLLIVPHFSIPSQREILPQRVPIKSVVGHDTAQVRMAGEEDTEQVVCLPLVPIRAIVKPSDGGNRSGLISVRLDTNTGTVPDREEVVDDLEAVVAGRVVNAGDVGDLCELRGGMVLEEGEDGYHAGGRDMDRKLVLPHAKLLNVLRQAGNQVFAVLMEGVRCGEISIGVVDHGSTELAHGRTPAPPRIGQFAAIRPLMSREVGPGCDGGTESHCRGGTARDSLREGLRGDG